MRPLLMMILFAAFTSGCRQQPAIAVKGDEPIIKSEPEVKLAPTAQEIEKRLQTEFADVYVILPQQKEFIAIEFADKLNAELKPFLDEQIPSRISTTGTHWFVKVNIAPVSDVEAFAKKQTIGRVLALDPTKRSLLIEYIGIYTSQIEGLFDTDEH